MYEGRNERQRTDGRDEKQHAIVLLSPARRERKEETANDGNGFSTYMSVYLSIEMLRLSWLEFFVESWQRHSSISGPAADTISMWNFTSMPGSMTNEQTSERLCNDRIDGINSFSLSRTQFNWMTTLKRRSSRIGLAEDNTLWEKMKDLVVVVFDFQGHTSAPEKHSN